MSSRVTHSRCRRQGVDVPGPGAARQCCTCQPLSTLIACTSQQGGVVLRLPVVPNPACVSHLYVLSVPQVRHRCRVCSHRGSSLPRGRVTSCPRSQLACRPSQQHGAICRVWQGVVASPPPLPSTTPHAGCSLLAGVSQGLCLHQDMHVILLKICLSSSGAWVPAGDLRLNTAGTTLCWFL